ncbi:alpha/beta fold hydrolase [Aquimarina sp. SS2-1]|uniref:alpha/beta fold hydrolase n=1 Tax=Aquimarina besae TaxID=3342247 RepID=UPI003671609C
MDIIIDTHRLKLSENPELFDSALLTVIFLHDSLGCIELWRDFPQKIKEAVNCNVLSYDRKGYGQSDPFSESERDHEYLTNEARVLGKLIDHLVLKNVVLFGHSDGGSIALIAASLFSEKIKGIITEGAHIFVEEETLEGIRNAKTAYATTSLKKKLSKYHGDKTESVFKMWTETWLSSSFLGWNIESYLPGIQCPSLIIQGEKDEYGTLKQVTSIVQKTSGRATSLIIPKIGHTPHKEAPEIVIKNTVNFISML